MAMVAARPDGQPVMEINTTPLIDVMLVLLIMFIITIPPQTNAVKLGLPSPVPGSSQPEPAANQIDIDVLGNVYWNSEAVSSATLAKRLRQAVAMPVEPQLRFRPDALTRYDVVDRVLATVQQAGVTKIAFVGNEAYAR